MPSYTPEIRILKRYKAVSINNLVNHFTITAHTLGEARSLLPSFVAITGWQSVEGGSL